MNLYRLIVGALVLAIVIPAWYSEVRDVARCYHVRSRRRWRSRRWNARAVTPGMLRR